MHWVRRLKRAGLPIDGWVNHGTGYERVGRADADLCVDGSFVAVEFKVDGNEQTETQRAEERAVFNAGGTYSVCYSLPQFKREVSALLGTDPSKLRRKVLDELSARDQVRNERAEKRADNSGDA